MVDLIYTGATNVEEKPTVLVEHRYEVASLIKDGCLASGPKGRSKEGTTELLRFRSDDAPDPPQLPEHVCGFVLGADIVGDYHQCQRSQPTTTRLFQP